MIQSKIHDKFSLQSVLQFKTQPFFKQKVIRFEAEVHILSINGV